MNNIFLPLTIFKFNLFATCFSSSINKMLIYWKRVFFSSVSVVMDIV